MSQAPGGLGLMARMGFKEICVHEKRGKLEAVWMDTAIVEPPIPDNSD